MKPAPILAIQSLAAALGETPGTPVAPDPAPRAKHEYVVFRVDGVKPLAKFIDDLKIARTASRDTGGVYNAFLHLADGRILQLEIGLTLEEK